MRERRREKELMERTRKASAALTGMPEEKVLAEAERLAPAPLRAPQGGQPSTVHIG